MIERYVEAENGKTGIVHLAPVLKMFDRNGDETVDPFRAYAAVIQLPDSFLSIEVNEYMIGAKH